jgi:general secretion pathway protein D
MIRKTASPAWVLVALCAVFAAGCAQVPMKPSAGHIRAESVARDDGNIPQPVQMAPVLPKPSPAVKPETYSVVVNNVRVQDLLFALARDAKVNIDIHPGVEGNVTLNAIDQTLTQLLSRLSRQIDMRYELDGQNLLVMRDTPFLRNYRIDYLNMTRDTKSQVTLTTAISSSSGGGASGGTGATGGTIGGGGTQQQITGTTSHKFWETLVANVKDILHETDKVIPGGGTQAAPVAPAAPPPAPAASGAPGAAAPATPAPVAAPVSSGFREAASVIANQEAGILSIRASSRQHERIQEFLDQVLANVRRQVLIEATVVEVRLNNEYQQGINWSTVRRSGITSLAQPGGNTGNAGVVTQNFTLGFVNAGLNLTAVMRFLESFGTLKVLSSPKISVINNQTAILRVVDNLVYFTIRSDISQNQLQTVQVFTTTVNPYSTGFVMSVTPQISNTDTVLLNVRPTITRQIGTAIDPNPALRDRGISNPVPLLQTREMDSILQVQSGQTAIMGGLMQDEVTDVEDGIPGVSGTILGRLLQQNRATNQKTELVILLRPTVLHDASLSGDFRSFRSLLPDSNFMQRPNDGKVEALESRGGPR